MQDYVEPGGRGGNESRKIGQGWSPRTQGGRGIPRIFAAFAPLMESVCSPAICSVSLIQRYSPAFPFLHGFLPVPPARGCAPGETAASHGGRLNTGTEKLSNDVELDVKC